MSIMTGARLRRMIVSGHRMRMFYSRNIEQQDHVFNKVSAYTGRSPCPGLNVLANHGWLPRSGKEIDLTAIRSAVSGGFNYEYYMFDTAVQMVWDFHLSTTKTPNKTFNLEDLKVHDKIEFDGSLSRNDFYSGDDLHFDPKIWATMAHRLNLYHDEKEKHVTIESAAKARAARVKDAMAANPTFNASALQQIGSYGTTALYLSTVWNHEVNAAFKKDVKAFFGKLTPIDSTTSTNKYFRRGTYVLQEVQGAENTRISRQHDTSCNCC